MKKIISILAFFTFIFICISCSEDILDVENPNALTTQNFWKSGKDAELGVNAIYTMFYKPGSWTRWIYFRYDLTSDEGYSISPWVELADWTRFQYVNYNFWEGGNWIWRDHYKAIFRCNQVLDNVPDIPFTDEQKKQHLLAQAKFLRAFYYFNLVSLWENVPLVLHASKPDDLPDYSTSQEVWTQIKQDLTDAIQVLPPAWPDNMTGRPTKGAALALLGKAHMQNREWQAAKDAFEWLVEGEGKQYYDLVPDFKDNFTHYNENNKESVFEIQFSDQSKAGDGDGPGASMGTNRAQFFAPRGIGWSDGQARYWLVEEFKKETTADGEVDPRLQHSLFYKELGADFPGDGKVYGRDWQWGDKEAWFRKYQRDYYRLNEDYHSEVNFRVIRYADVLLMYAEALNALDRTADAYQYVNSVRARANLSPLEITYPSIGNNKDLFLDRLKMERALELNGESVRWNDLKRWGDLDSQEAVDEIRQRDPDFNNFVVGKHYRLPLPQIEVDNNPKLIQNTPY